VADEKPDLVALRLRSAIAEDQLDGDPPAGLKALVAWTARAAATEQELRRMAPRGGTNTKRRAKGQN
jgi:hypothetical protein